MIRLGQKVRDKVTGFEGIVTARVEYLNGCIQYAVKPKVTSEGKVLEAEYIDEAEIEIIDDGVIVASTDAGGPQRDCPKS